MKFYLSEIKDAYSRYYNDNARKCEKLDRYLAKCKSKEEKDKVLKCAFKHMLYHSYGDHVYTSDEFCAHISYLIRFSYMRELLIFVLFIVPDRRCEFEGFLFDVRLCIKQSDMYADDDKPGMHTILENDIKKLIIKFFYRL